MDIDYTDIIYCRGDNRGGKKEVREEGADSIATGAVTGQTVQL